jgi:hypothetical protein
MMVQQFRKVMFELPQPSGLSAFLSTNLPFGMSRKLQIVMTPIGPTLPFEAPVQLNRYRIQKQNKYLGIHLQAMTKS